MAQDLITSYLPTVYSYVLRRAPSVQEAEDITAEVFAAGFTALPRFRGQGTCAAWLIGIARRKLADSARRRKWVGQTGSLDALQSVAAAATDQPEGALARTEAQHVVQELIADLPDAQREALLLQYADGLSINDIAAVMKRSPAAVNSLLQRARQTIFNRGHAYFLAEEEVHI